MFNRTELRLVQCSHATDNYSLRAVVRRSPCNGDEPSIESRCCWEFRQVTEGFVRRAKDIFRPMKRPLSFRRPPRNIHSTKSTRSRSPAGRPKTGQHGPGPHDVQLFFARRQAHSLRLSHLDPHSIRPKPTSASGKPKTRPAAAPALRLGVRSVHGHFPGRSRRRATSCG